jgi:hypothetical protein
LASDGTIGAWSSPTRVSDGEPISKFASHSAKHFSHRMREGGLFAVAPAGIAFAPGGAGTRRRVGYAVMRMRNHR